MGLSSKPLNKVRADVPIKDVIKEDMVRININVPDSLRQQWKMASVESRKPMTDMIIEAMSIYMNTHVSK